jgi:steroid delta-isomerase-like uncharacterized protein
MMDPRACVQAAYDAVADRDLDKLCSLVSEDYHYTDVPLNQILEGRQALRASMEDWFRGIPDVHVASARMLSEGRTVAVELEIAGTHLGPFLDFEASGRSVRFKGCGFYELDPSDDLVKTERFYYDYASLIQQLQPE